MTTQNKAIETMTNAIEIETIEFKQDFESLTNLTKFAEKDATKEHKAACKEARAKAKLFAQTAKGEIVIEKTKENLLNAAAASSLISVLSPKILKAVEADVRKNVDEINRVVTVKTESQFLQEIDKAAALKKARVSEKWAKEKEAIKARENIEAAILRKFVGSTPEEKQKLIEYYSAL
jgi:hypothetical protein